MEEPAVTRTLTELRPLSASACQHTQVLAVRLVSTPTCSVDALPDYDIEGGTELQRFTLPYAPDVLPVVISKRPIFNALVITVI